MPTAVVTGGAGFLGSHLCDLLVSKDYRVVCVDNLDTGSLQNVEHLRGDNFLFINQDVTHHLEIEGPVDAVEPQGSEPPQSTADEGLINLSI